MLQKIYSVEEKILRKKKSTYQFFPETFEYFTDKMVKRTYSHFSNFCIILRKTTKTYTYLSQVTNYLMKNI